MRKRSSPSRIFSSAAFYVRNVNTDAIKPNRLSALRIDGFTSTLHPSDRAVRMIKRNSIGIGPSLCNRQLDLVPGGVTVVLMDQLIVMFLSTSKLPFFKPKIDSSSSLQVIKPVARSFSQTPMLLLCMAIVSMRRFSLITRSVSFRSEMSRAILETPITLPALSLIGEIVSETSMVRPSFDCRMVS